MRLDINKKPQLLVIFPTLLIVVVHIFKHLYSGDSTEIIESNYGIASQQLYQLFGNLAPINNNFSTIIYLIGGVLLTKLSIVKTVFTEKSLSPLILYVIFSISFFSTQNNIIEALTSLLVILSLNRLLTSFNSKVSNFHYLFTAGIILGITPLLIPQAVFILPIIIIACILFKRSINEIVISISGYILPTLLYSYILWAMKYPFSLIFNNIYTACSEWNYIGLKEYLMVDSPYLYSTIFLFATIIIATIALITYNVRDREHKQTPSGSIFMIFGYLGAITLPTLLISSNPTSLTSVIAIPLSILISSFFIQHNNRFGLLLYVIIVIASMCI